MIKNYTKFFQVLLLIFLLIFLSNCAKNPNQIVIDNGKNLIKINVEIADDDNTRMKGLMFREKLEENNGMLFVFEEGDYQTFWMKNTLIPLDIIFIDKGMKIVDIKYAVPCQKDPCILYKSSKSAKYVLEMNGNFTTRNSIKPGDKIILICVVAQII